MYSYWTTIKKVAKQLVIFLLTILAAGLLAKYPETANFTILGTFTVYSALQFLVDWLKHRWNIIK